MQRIGLALSGGGFRATLFHLGMIRFLREANILPNVTHITSVSGGSILGAHLALHWQRYNGSLKDFDAAAAELIRFVQLDIRNRVLRRYPLGMPWRMLRRLALRRAQRRLTLTGLLEYHYEQYLFGDTCLFQLPQRPQLYVLATNLSEGCLCAFSRDGLLMQRRLPGQRFRFDRIHTGLATVPMAVTASSAFPGLFPPFELRGQDVGADPGQFGRVAFTDGGVYDNLGVRMMRCVEQSWMAREFRLQRDDLADADEVARALEGAAQASDDTPLRRLAQMLDRPSNGAARSMTAPDQPVDRMIDGLWSVMNHENLARHSAFAQLPLPNPDVETLLNAAQRPGGEIEPGEQLWLNRQLVDAAYRQATGKPCFRSLNVCFDAVLVSDAGKQFKIANNARAGGLVSTAMRAADIGMDRVWQLEIATFTGTPGFVFAPISKVVELDEDPTALHPEVQRAATDIRTDLDRFSPLEISALVRHGYCVGRSACRSRPDLFGATIPDEPPWDPIPAAARSRPSLFLVNRQTAPLASNAVDNGVPSNSTPAPDKGAKPVLEPTLAALESRQLQQSAGRRVWSTLLDYRDWVSYLYVPLLVPILIVLPYFLVKWYHQSQVVNQLVRGLAQNNRDFSILSKLLQDGPVAPFPGMPVQEDRELAPLDYSGFEVIADTRLFDYRPWRLDLKQPDERSWGYIYRRLRVRKVEPSADEFAVRVRLPAAKVKVRPQSNAYPAVLRGGRVSQEEDGKPVPTFEIAFDVSMVPAQDVFDVSFEFVGHELPEDLLQSGTVYVDAKTTLLTCWLLLPEGRHQQSMELLRYPIGKASSPERVTPANELVSPTGAIVAFTLLTLEPGYKYERRWTYRE